MKKEVKVYYENPKHPSNKVVVFNRGGRFYIEYNMPMLKEKKAIRSLKIPVDVKLATASMKDPNWWKSSVHKDEIRRAIHEARDSRNKKIWAYLDKHCQLSVDERDPQYDNVVKYLLARDKPLIAAFFFAVIEEAGLELVFEKIPRGELWRLNTEHLLRSWNWISEEFEEPLSYWSKNK